MRNNLWVITLMLITFLVFSPSLFCGITNWDDHWMVTENPLIRSLAYNNLKFIFTEIYKLNYQPLVLLSYALEYSLFGLNPVVFHLTNILLHLINVFLVYKLISHFTPKHEVAFICAALFALHPTRVESVTWITERRDLLYSLFFLLSLICYTKYIRHKTYSAYNGSKREIKPYILKEVEFTKVRVGRGSCSSSQTATAPATATCQIFRKIMFVQYISAFVFFLLSCLSKGMAVSLSLAIIPIDFLLKRRFDKKAIIDKIPFFALSLVFGYITVSAVLTEGQMKANEYYSLIEKIQLSSFGILFYLQKLLIPSGLSAFHPYPPLEPGHFPGYYWLFTVAAGIIFGLTVFSVIYTRKLLFGFLFFLFTLVFVLQLFPAHAAIVSEHYSYIPYIGFFYLAGEGFSAIINHKNVLNSAGIKLAIRFFAAVIIITLSAVTVNRIGVWKNNITLWTDVANKYPNNFFGYYNRAQAHSVNENYKEAIKDLDLSISLNPYYSESYNLRGSVNQKLKNYEKAIEDFKKAIKMNPDEVNAWCNKGTVYFEMGNYHDALLNFDKSIALDPNLGKAYVNRANAKAAMKNYEDALSDILKAIELDSSDFKPFLDCGNILAMMKNYNEAIVYYSKAIGLNPECKDAYFNRGSSKLYLKIYPGACDDWRKSLELGNAPALKMIKKNCE